MCVCVNVLKEDRISFYFKCFVIVVVVVVVVSKNQGTLKMVFKVHSISLPPPTKIMTSMCIPKKILTELKKNSVCVCGKSFKMMRNQGEIISFQRLAHYWVYALNRCVCVYSQF